MAKQEVFLGGHQSFSQFTSFHDDRFVTQMYNNKWCNRWWKSVTWKSVSKKPPLSFVVWPLVLHSRSGGGGAEAKAIATAQLLIAKIKTKHERNTKFTANHQKFYEALSEVALLDRMNI